MKNKHNEPPLGIFPTKKQVAEYAKAQKASGLEIGDRVRVVRIARSYEGGWDNDWVNTMDRFVGRVGVIVRELGAPAGNGIYVSFSRTPSLYPYAFPFFVLEKVETKRKPIAPDKKATRKAKSK